MSTVVEPGTNEHEAVARGVRAPEAHSCPSCGAPADPGQLMCLECGSRLALDYRRSPSWLLPAAITGAAVLLAGIVLAIALVAANNDTGKTTAASPAQPAPAQSASAGAAPTPSQPTPAPTASTPTPAPAPAAPSGGAPADTATGATTTPTSPTPASASSWPPGKSAFTVILASVPTKAEADAKLQTAKAAGIATAAILHSDDFPTLRPGYWVVFDGQYDSNDQAKTQAAADRGKGFADAYPRFVSKSQDARP